MTATCHYMLVSTLSYIYSIISDIFIHQNYSDITGVWYYGSIGHNLSVIVDSCNALIDCKCYLMFVIKG